MRWRAASLEYARGVDWAAVATWLLCFGLVAYLGLDGGGFDPLVHDPVGIAVWWIALGGVLIGALPRRRPGQLAWGALALLAAFVLWTALSLTWTESSEETAADLARIAGYLGVFALVLFARAEGDARRIVGAVATAIALVCGIALLSRLHPSWFPEANETARILNDPERLSYPLNYWNALGGFVAIGLPLLLQVATCARSALLRALAAATVPALALTAIFTLSRGGIAAGFLALAIFLALTSDRLPKLLTLLLTGAGSTILVVALQSRDALQEGLLGPLAREQGDELLTITIIVCVAVGVIHYLGTLALRGRERPAWSVVPRSRALNLTAVGAVVVLVAAVALDGPGRAADGWDEFKAGGGPGSGTSRLGSVAGQSRYEFWKAAVDENATKPLTGTGSGTFEYWWARNGTTDETVLDTHSLYLQTLGELGIVGLALLVAFLLTVLAGGVRATLRAGPRVRPALAAAVAGCAAFCLTAVVDWMWQVPVLPVAVLLLAAVLVTAGKPPSGEARLSLPLRLGFAAAAIAAIAAIAIPYTSTAFLRESEAAAREGDLEAALADARSAQNAEPGAASPRLQEALVLEQMGALAPAEAAALAATERESTNWRTWLVLSRIQAQRGRVDAAVESYREARSLNPRSELFERED